MEAWEVRFLMGEETLIPRKVYFFRDGKASLIEPTTPMPGHTSEVIPLPGTPDFNSYPYYGKTADYIKAEIDALNWQREQWQQKRCLACRKTLAEHSRYTPEDVESSKGATFNHPKGGYFSPVSPKLVGEWKGHTPVLDHFTVPSNL